MSAFKLPAYRIRVLQVKIKKGKKRKAYFKSVMNCQDNEPTTPDILSTHANQLFGKNLIEFFFFFGGGEVHI